MPAETQWDARLGTVLEGAYRITRLIGEGGMGAVYEAVQLRLNKRVAIKLMARQLTANREALARFLREAEITSHLGHPNLVNVVDFGTSEAGDPYLVMEYLEGEDLDNRLRHSGTLPINLAAHITKQAASALAAAHAQGIVHRDLKPGNVFLLHVPGELDFVKVLDFGISKVKAAGVKLTNTAIALGTPHYMSPEQAAGRVDDIDHQVDQWALACITWEMLSGRCPFEADDVTALFFQIMNLSPQPLLPHVPDLAPEAEQVLLRALSKSPRDRFPSIRDFAHAFEAAAMGRPADLTPAPVMLSQPSASRESADFDLNRTSEFAAASAATPPKEVGAFSRSPGETTAPVPRGGWSRLGLTPVRAAAIIAGALALLGAILLLRPRPQSPVPAEIPIRPAVVALPPAAPPPTPPAQVEATPKPVERSAKPAASRSRAKRARHLEDEDPFESAATGRQKAARTTPPSDVLHRNDGTAPRPKLKRRIIKEL